MRDQQHLDDLSVRAAVAQWRSGEASFSADVRSTDALTLQQIDRWLAFWGLDDRLRHGQREQFLTFLEQIARPVFRGIREPSPDAYAQLDEVNFQAVRAGVTTSSLLVMLTRFACACEPTVFAPVTQHSRRGIQTLGRRLPDMSYRTYMLAFVKERERFADRVANLVLADGSTPAGTAVPLDVLVMRALDSRLMLAGGYPPERLEAVLQPVVSSVTRRTGARGIAARQRLYPDQAAG